MGKLKKEGCTNDFISITTNVPLRTVQRHTVGLGPKAWSGLIPIPETAREVTAEKAKIHAYLAAEGAYEVTERLECDHRTGCRYHQTRKILHFYNKTPTIWNDFIKCVEKVYGYTPYQLPCRYVIKIKRVAVVNDLLNWGPYSSSQWRIPSAILNSNKDIQLNWFAALFDSEGHVPLNKKNSSGIRLKMINYAGLKQVESMCKNLGFACYLQGPRYSKNSHHSPIYTLYFPKANAIKFLEVPLVHPKKVWRIHCIASKFVNRPYNSQKKLLD